MQRKPKTINKKRLVRYKEGAEMYSMGTVSYTHLTLPTNSLV